jgi:3-(3-hydroxy-phenyl)propionate hydroxylase
VAATQENLSYGTKSTEFMAPPSFAFDLMRKAVLSLAVRHPALSSLINPRQTSAITYLTSPLNVVERAGEFECGPVPGQSLPECPVTIVEKGAAREGHLTDLITPAVTAIYFADHGSAPPALIELAVRMRKLGVPFVLTTLTRHLFVDVLEKHGWDHTGRLFDMYGATPGTLYIVRPDGHVLGRWRRFDAEATRAAIDHMLNF